MRPIGEADAEMISLALTKAKQMAIRRSRRMAWLKLQHIITFDDLWSAAVDAVGESWNKWDGRGDYPGYCCGYVKHRLIDLTRQRLGRGKQRTVPTFVPAEAADRSPALVYHGNAKRVESEGKRERCPLCHALIKPERNGFTKRDLDMWELTAAGLNYRQIAEKLGTSHRTVANQLLTLRRKLGGATDGAIGRMWAERKASVGLGR
jgi:DNA-binding CsgD family transcriptional regulator